MLSQRPVWRTSCAGMESEKASSLSQVLLLLLRPSQAPMSARVAHLLPHLRHLLLHPLSLRNPTQPPLDSSTCFHGSLNPNQAPLYLLPIHRHHHPVKLKSSRYPFPGSLYHFPRAPLASTMARVLISALWLRFKEREGTRHWRWRLKLLLTHSKSV